MIRFFTHLKSLAYRVMTGLAERLRQWTQPLTETLVGVSCPQKLYQSE